MVPTLHAVKKLVINFANLTKIMEFRSLNLAEITNLKLGLTCWKLSLKIEFFSMLINFSKLWELPWGQRFESHENCYFFPYIFRFWPFFTLIFQRFTLGPILTSNTIEFPTKNKRKRENDCWWRDSNLWQWSKMILLLRVLTTRLSRSHR